MEHPAREVQFSRDGGRVPPVPVCGSRVCHEVTGSARDDLVNVLLNLDRLRTSIAPLGVLDLVRERRTLLILGQIVAEDDGLACFRSPVGTYGGVSACGLRVHGSWVRGLVAKNCWAVAGMLAA